MMLTSKWFDAEGNRVNPGQYFFGGGPKPPKAPEPVQTPPPPQMPIAKPPPPPKPIPPAPTTSSFDVQQAQDDQRVQNARRNGIQKTLIAGETGGYSPAAGTGNKSLLG